MRSRRAFAVTALTGAAIASTALLTVSIGARPAMAQGVGDATWTPSRSTTTVQPSGFLVPDDSLVFQTDAVWERSQVEGLESYLADGLRYTHETNDRSGRLSATGYWATNHPDPAFDRDDDDGDGRWEEAEIISGPRPPVAGQPYSSIVEFSRWHPKRQGGRCEWAWDVRLGEAEVLSQLSRELLGEWQAERYTLTYETSPFTRVGPRPAMPEGAARAHCQDPRPGPGQSGVVVTFSAPLAWPDLLALPAAGSGQWTAFEAIGTSDRDDLRWTCGGPVGVVPGLARCRDLGVTADGVVAAAGYFDGGALDELRAAPAVARVAELQDAVTELLFDVGGLGVERPGLTVNDSYWELFLPDA
jgi:hypothetical protein